MSNTNLKSVHLAWTAFQRRQESMRNIVGFECWFYPLPRSGRLGKLIIYLLLLVKSVRELLRASPQVVWVQLPQVPALWAALIYRALKPSGVKVVADCHNAQLRRPWSHFPLANWSLGKADAILIHNEALRKMAPDLGWPIEKVLVVEDVPASGMNKPSSGLAASHIDAPKPWIVFPGSFAADEPIAEVFETARRMPHCSFIITGRPERAEKNGHDISKQPPNVILPGFLSLALFDDLLRESDVVMGLTKEEGIQLSVCNEALGFGKPLVTSDTEILSKMFGDAAVLVNPRDPASVANGCVLALNNPQEYEKKSLLLAETRVRRWESEQLASLSRLLGSANP